MPNSAPVTPITPPSAGPAPALDPTIVNLAKAIRQTETRGQPDPYTAKGASGEYGAYQYTSDTWNSDVLAYTGKKVPLEQADKILQNEVAYKKLKALKDAGNNVGQIASIWNSGSPDWQGKVGVNKLGVKYDVPKYVDAVANAYQALKAGQEPIYQDTNSTVGKEQIVTPTQQADQANAQKYGSFFPAVTGDSSLSAGLKTAGNVLPSAFNFAKGVAQFPLTIAQNLAKIPGEAKALINESGGVGKALSAFGKEVLPSAYETIVPEAGRQLLAGDTEGAQRSITNDPFGQIAPFVFGAKGLTEGIDSVTGRVAKAGMADYVKNIEANTKNGVPIPKQTGTNLSPALDAGMEKIASTVTKPIGYAFGKAGDIAGATAKYGVSKVTGFNPETIDAIKANPKQFTPEAMASMTRKSLGAEVASSLKERSAAVSETGSEYGSIRKGATPVAVNPNYIDSVIQETTGLAVKKGKLTATGKSSIRDAGDIRALQQVYDLWKPEFKKGNLTPEEFLNFRSDLAKMAGYGRELTKSKPLQNLSGIMRGKLNTTYRGKIAGLKELDEKFGPMTSDYQTLSKDFIDSKTGELKDVAINRIANAAGKGKDALLARLEEIKPGITHRIRVLKAIEDVQNIHKVGTYTKSALEGGGLVGGIATGNLPLIAGSIATLLLSQPEVAVRMIRAYGNTKALASEVIKKISTPLQTVNNLPDTKKSVFGRDVKELPVSAGLAMKDVSGVPPELAPIAKAVNGMKLNDAEAVYKKLKSTGSAIVAERPGMRLILKDEGDFVRLGLDTGKLTPTDMQLPEKTFRSMEEAVTALRPIYEMALKQDKKGSITTDKGGTPIIKKGSGTSLADPSDNGGIYYHGTTMENRASLLKHGINNALNKKGHAEQPEAFYIASKDEAGMYGDKTGLVGIRVKKGETVKTLALSSQEWTDTVGKSRSAEETATALKALREKGYDAINNGDEIEILNPGKFEVFDPKRTNFGKQ